MKQSSIVHSDPNILGGTPVFVGTRVPVQALIDYLEGGHTLEEFLSDFPTVRRELAADSREIAQELLQRMAAFQVIDKRLNGDPGSYEHWSTSQNVRVGVNDRRLLHWNIRNDVMRMLLPTLRGR